MTRTQIINKFITKYNYKNYLELGLYKPEGKFTQIIAEHKTGVDPWTPLELYPEGAESNLMSSDTYFSQLDKDKKFDIIFIDGNHDEEFVDRDIVNSLKHLTEKGTLIMHDCNPPDRSCEGFRKGCGTVWKSFYKLRKNNLNLDTYVIDTDWGVGIVRGGVREDFIELPESVLDYDFFDKNRDKILNLKTVQQFNTRFDLY